MYSKWIFILTDWIDKNILVYLKLVLSLFLIAGFSAAFAASNGQLLDKIKILEKDFILISAEFYKDKENQTSASSISITNIDKLLEKVTTLKDGNRATEAIRLIYNNIDTAQENIDHPAIFTFVETLLNHNEIDLAKSLFQAIKNDGDDFQLASIQFIFAKYHATRFEWSEVNKLLENVSEELSVENSEYASLLKGTALQHLKLHRLAQESYRHIPDTSKFYSHAQLNSAIAQIRQGWLTNATGTINKLIIKTNNSNDDEFINRLYLVLGYALLQKDYYRSAREAFREISLNSQFVNRALLGIALCAINQQDYNSSLNTLFLLKDKKTTDLSVDESYLLIPYVYEKLKQQTNVSASSTEALNYYQKRIANLQNVTKQAVNFNQLKFEMDKPVFNIYNNNLAYGDNYPKSFLINYRQLLSFASINKNPKLAKIIESEISSYNEVFTLIINQLVDQQVSFLDSYLNQVRYGLARLYDNSNQEQK